MSFGITCIVLENGDPDVVVLRVVKRNPGRGGGKLIPDSERPWNKAAVYICLSSGDIQQDKEQGFEVLVACWVCFQRVTSLYCEEKVADGSAPYQVAVGECNCAESGTASSKTELAGKKLQTTLSDSCSGGGRGVWLLNCLCWERNTCLSDWLYLSPSSHRSSYHDR